MFKRPEDPEDCHVSAKRARFDAPRRNPQHSKAQEIPEDLWGDDFAEEDIQEMDLIASQACSQTSNIFNNSKPFQSGSHSMKSGLPERPSTTAYKETSRLKLLQPMEKSGLYTMKKDIQGKSQDIADINYSQFRNKLINTGSHNSTFQRRNNFIVSDDKELEKLKNENKKLLNDFITKDGETVYLRQQLQQIQLRTENEKLEKMHLIEEQANSHRLEVNEICKEKEQLKTQLELQNLEIRNLQERCKRLESRDIKLEEPQSLYMNTSLNRSKCNTSINRPTNTNKNQVKEVCVQANIYKNADNQLQACSTYYPLAGISELMFEASLPEKPIVNIKVIEKTGRRNLPILQEEETFRIFENPDCVKPIITIVDEKKLTIEFVLLEIAAIERKANTEIESEKCIPIINKLVLTTRELMLNVVEVLQMIFQAMRNDDIRDMNDLYFSNVYENHNICIKSECEANAWHEGERGIEARRSLGALSRISLESSYLSNYLAGKSPLLTRNDECYNRYLPQMTRYNAWPKKNHEFEILEIILECVTLIGRVRRSHQFTGLINAIIKVLCNVQRKVDFCKKGLEYICLIFKEIVFSRPLSLCYVSLADFLMIFSKCYTEFVPKLCNSSQSMAIKGWKGVLHFTPDACVLQILMMQLEHFHPDFVTTVNITHGLISSVWDILQTNNNLLRIVNSESCNCYMKLLRITINMLKKSSETKLDIIDNTKWQNSFSASKRCYILKKINYKNYTCQTKCSEQNMEEHLSDTYPEKLDQNFWLGIKKIQHKILKQGIRFLSHLAICNPEFLAYSSDMEDMFNLFIRNIAFFDDLILDENEREALDIIKITLFNKSIQNEAEIPHKDIHVHQLNIRYLKKEIIPGTKRDHVETIKDSNRTYMTIKALYNLKLIQK